MADKHLAEIISVGTEILRGETLDTNAGYLASELPLLGIELGRISTVGDSIDELCQIIRQALTRCDLVISSGGLGPTEDDLTRDSIASVLGETPEVDPEQERQLRALFARMGREMPSHNLRQALLIPSAKALPNPRGTAPGWWAEKDGKTIVALPGPPRELVPMWRNEVVPRLQSRFPGQAILARTVKTFVIAEAKVAELLQPFFESANPEIGIYSKPDGIHVRLIAHGDDATEALDAAEARLKEILSPHVWGTDSDTLEDVVSDWLCRSGLTVATMEDGTTGLVASLISEATSSRACFRGGLIAGTDEMKSAWGVPAELIERHGAISAEVAEAMARAVRERFSSDFGLSMTAIAGIDNSDGKQPGLSFVGVAGEKEARAWQQIYPPSRGDARHRAAIAGLFRLRERLIELGVAPTET